MPSKTALASNVQLGIKKWCFIVKRELGVEQLRNWRGRGVGRELVSIRAAGWIGRGGRGGGKGNRGSGLLEKDEGGWKVVEEGEMGKCGGNAYFVDEVIDTN